MGPLDEGCRECDVPATGVWIGDGVCNVCHGTGIDDDFRKCRRCRDANGECPRCNGKGYHFGSGHSPYPREPDDDEDTGGGGGGGSGGGLDFGELVGELFHSWFSPEKGWMSGFRGIYIWASGALWLAYFVALGLRAVGLITPETAAGIQGWLNSTVQSPLGIALMLFFSVGLIVTGLALIALIFVTLVPLAILLTLLSICLKAPQPWPIVGVGGGVAVLVVCFRWLARKA